MINRVDELENLFVLSSHVRVYVPSAVDVDTVSDTSEQLEDTKRLLSHWFGGATAYRALGSWLSGAGGLVEEDVTIVESYCSEDQLTAHVGDVITHARHLKAVLSQESIAIEVQHKLYLV